MDEMDELRARLAQVELERDQAVADLNRRNTQLAQMEETQRTLHEHLYIIKTKYETAKVRRPPTLPAASAPFAELSAPKRNQAENQSLLWNYLPSSSPEFRGVSEAGGCHAVEFETDSRVDDIQLEHITGEGRFGEVRTCARAEE